MRIASGPGSKLANERIHKQLWSDFSALPTGLAKPEIPLTRLIPLARTCSALSAEGFALSHPVSLTYRSQLGEGVEDHASMAPLSVHTTARLINVARRVATLELMISACAIDLRGDPSLGAGTEIAYEIVHAHPTLDANVWKTEIERVFEAVSGGQLLYWINDAITNRQSLPVHPQQEHLIPELISNETKLFMLSMSSIFIFTSTNVSLFNTQIPTIFCTTLNDIAVL